MTQEQEREYCYYEEQDDLESVKEWIEWTRSWRSQEAEFLEEALEEAATEVDSFEKELKKIRAYRVKSMFDIGGPRLDRNEVEIERYLQMIENRRVSILRQLRDLENAMAGLDLGGGKAVIWGDPARDKSEPLLRAYGRFVESLGGRYVTACDVGTYVADMDIVAKETRWVTGRSESHGGAGDSSVLTAYGVFQGMRAAADHLWSTPSVSGRRVGVAGVGKVGKHLVKHLLDDGAFVVVTDVSERALDWVRQTYPAVDVVSSAQELITSDIDIYAPCALGGALNDDSVGVLRAKIVAGAANNQLAHPGIEKILEERGILYAPDYVVNSGGVIQVADELEGFNFERAKGRAAGIFTTTKQILALADTDGVPPAVAADRLAERRMAECGRLRTILLR